MPVGILGLRARILSMATVRNDHERTTFAPTSGGIGATLHRARRGRGAELAQASRETRIPPVFLQALEDDAPLARYPAPVYARYFLREYAQYLGLEADPLVDAFDRIHEIEDEPKLQEPPLAPIERGSRRWPAAVLVVISVLTGVVIFVTGQRPGEVQTPTGPVPTPPAATPSSPGALVVPTTSPTPQPPTFEGVHAVLQVDSDCWIRATVDGEVVFSQTVSSERLVFRADEELFLELGSAGAVRITVNGDPVETGTLGTPERYRFEWRDGELVTTLT